MQILFFHGFQYGEDSDAQLATWKSEDGSCVWPQTWLVEEFPGARVFSVSYSACVTNSCKDGKFDMKIIGENLTSDLMRENIGQEKNCPTILVGHSFGGLVIKQLCWEAYQSFAFKAHYKCKKFLQNIKGIFFYGTPHHGSPSIDRAAKRLRLLGGLDGPLLEYVMILSREGERLNFDFDRLRNSSDDYKWLIHGLGESLPTQSGMIQGWVAPESSARFGDTFHVVQGDNISICQPNAKTSRKFYALTNLLDQIARDLKEEEDILLQQSEEPDEPDNFQNLPPHILGIDLVLEEVKHKLQTDTSLGLYGMGGQGKTTLAMGIFNNLGPRYKYTCFLHKVKDLKEELVETALLQNLYLQGKKVGDGGRGLRILRGEQLFLVLDDVEDRHQLKIVSVLQNNVKVHQDSRFVTTSRDAQVLRGTLDNVFEVPSLHLDTAKVLFCKLAFRDNRDHMPMPSLSRHVDAIVKKCRGLPLSLEVLGKYLYKKPEEDWKNTLEALANVANVRGCDEEIWKSLKPSYDGLDELEKEMFLDAAAIFLKMVVAQAAWSGFMTKADYCLRWKHLVDLSLVYVDDVGYICMHDQLRSLGQKLATTTRIHTRKAWELLRQSNCNVDNVQDIVSVRLLRHGMYHYDDDEVPDDLRGLDDKTAVISSDKLCQMKKLRYLQLEYMDIGEGRGAVFPSTLVFLHWLGAIFTELPFDPNSVKKLSFLYISGCFHLRALPDSFGQLRSLQMLVLWQLESLESLPESFGQLCSLQVLTISNVSLVKLPDSFGQLCSLQVLTISNVCLVKMPDSFGQLCSLQVLTIFNVSLVKMPDSLGHLRSLRELNIEKAQSLVSLPESFGQLWDLEKLRLQCCSKLETLPPLEIGALPKLTYLVISMAFRLTALPDSFGNLSQLQHLEMEECHGLETLPDSFGSLSQLQHLEIRECHGLETLPDSFGTLSQLQHFVIYRCDVLKTLPDSFGSLSQLQHLEIIECHGLETLPDSFGSLPQLQHLTIDQCDRLETLPDSFGNLSQLQHLEVEECDGLETLSDSFGNLSQLQHLEIRECRGLKTLPDSFGNLSQLQHLEIKECHGFETLPDSFGNLSQLHHLEIIGCEGLKTLPDSFGNLIPLKTLKLEWFYIDKLPTKLANEVKLNVGHRCKCCISCSFEVVDGKFLFKHNEEDNKEEDKEENEEDNEEDEDNKEIKEDKDNNGL